MLPSFLLALREGIEAALIVGIVLGVLKKMNRLDRVPYVWLGVAAAAAVSILGAIGLNLMGAKLEGAAEQVFEGVTMLLAASVLTWMIFWMQRQGRLIQTGLEADVKTALTRGQAWALFSLAFFAVVREGIELALFLTAANFSAAEASQTPFLGWLGGVLGLIAAVIVGWLLFDTTVKLNLRRFFQLTGVLLIVFAAGLFGTAVHEFNELGWIPSVVEHIYDVNSIVPESSLVGQFLKALLGYNGNPSLTETIAYAGYFAAIVFLVRWLDRRVATSPVSA